MILPTASGASAPVTAVQAIPVNPISSPFGTLFATFTPVQVFGIVFFLIFVVWAIYTIVFIYHWFRYNRSSPLTIPFITLHLMVSAFLFLMASSGFLTAL